MKRSSTRPAKIRWLRSNSDIWERHYGSVNTEIRIFRLMRAAGLYSSRTHPADSGIGRMINLIRLQRREQGREEEQKLPSRPQWESWTREHWKSFCERHGV